MYRILDANSEVKERRDQRTHPVYQKPELLATAPNQVWSWDITLKYRPDFPDRFGCIEDSRRFAQDFFAWYNTAHHHSGIGLLTPETVHYGLADQMQKARGTILSAAYEAHPERFVRKRPAPPSVPTAVWINRPKEHPVSQEDRH